MKKIYIAGKITGLDIKSVYHKFFQAEHELKSKGYDVINPLRLHEINSLEDFENHIPKPANEYYIVDFHALLECNEIYVLNDWFDSKGANGEMFLAQFLDLKIIYQHGTEEGEHCNRDGCCGLIIKDKTETSCTCFLGNPPCSHCTTPLERCLVCDWSER